jgi:hypothetical protein
MFVVAACGDTPTPTAPTAVPTPEPPATVLTGQVTNRVTGTPIAGANVVASYPALSAATDTRGNYSLADLPAWFAYVWAAADGHEEDVHKYQTSVQHFRLRPIQRITAGEVTAVTVSPDDSLCNNDTDSLGWGADLVCRVVRIVAPAGGTVIVDAISVAGGARPRLVVETRLGPNCCAEPRNPASIKVTAGTEIVAYVALPADGTTSGTFTVATSIRRE